MRKIYIILIVVGALTLVAAIAFVVILSVSKGKPGQAVPAQAAPITKTISVGAYYHTYDAKDSPFWQRYLREKLNIQQQPQLGEYTCRDEAVIKQHLDWARGAGIDFFAMNWFGPGSASDVTIKNYFSAYLKRAKSDFKFCLVYQTPYILTFEKGVVIIDHDSLRLLQNHLLYAADEYFKEPNYLKINNRPVVFIYVSHLLRGDYELALTKTCNVVQQRTGLDIFLVGDEVIFPEGDSRQTRPDKKRIAVFDAITAHTIVGPTRYDGLPVLTGFFKDLDALFRSYQQLARESNGMFIPCAMPGFNNRGYNKEADKYSILPREATVDKENEGTTYAVYLDIARKYVDPSLGMLMINSFNGFSDDTQIEPVTSDFMTPGSAPAELTGGYRYYNYQDLYLRLTKEGLKE
ncbi:MAG: glycoside hydrolase family 99-like domain-containing protein [Planctomycetes bacterium]|nr:glycoside hydrolase family 99-like domain-containing protein [Planctomycetota bacterium]